VIFKGKGWEPEFVSYAVRRRSERVLMDVPVIVRGELEDERPFQEETFTVTVSAHGALFMLAAKVKLGEKLVLMNAQTKEARDGRVAYIGPEHAGLSQVAIEFGKPAPELWAIDAPPKDWRSE
jgi:PilZ domain